MFDLFGEKERLKDLFGNSQLKEYISDALQNDSLSHAYIVEGGTGSGRHTLVRGIAKELAPDFSEKINNNNEADVVTIAHDETHKAISVDQVREFKRSCLLTPTELDFKMYIFEQADLMHAEAQNALLKTLEEPPAGVYIFLLCESTNGILPTVISRAPVLRMEIFDDATLGRYILDNDKKCRELYDKNREAYDFALRSSGGRIGEAIRRMSKSTKATENESIYTDARQCFEYLSQENRRELLLLLSRYSSQKEDSLLLCTVLEEAVRDLLLAKAYTDKQPDVSTMFFFSYDECYLLSQNFTLSSLSEMASEICTLHEKLETNANTRLNIILLSQHLWKALKD